MTQSLPPFASTVNYIDYYRVHLTDRAFCEKKRQEVLLVQGEDLRVFPEVTGNERMTFTRTVRGNQKKNKRQKVDGELVLHSIPIFLWMESSEKCSFWRD